MRLGRISLNNQNPTFHYCSEIRSFYREELKKLFFFNPCQHKCERLINAVVNKYGEPRIVDISNGNIAMTIQNHPDCNCMFISTGPLLLGVAIYVIEGEVLNILHLAVRQNYPKSNWIPAYLMAHLKSHTSAKKIKISYA